MKNIEFIVRESRGLSRKNYLAEQGIPVPKITEQEAKQLIVVDSNGNPAKFNIQIESTDYEGLVKWVLVSVVVDLKANEEKIFVLKDSGSKVVFDNDTLNISDIPSLSVGHIFTVKNKYYSFELTNNADIKLITDKGTILDGKLDMSLITDARSAVGNLRPVQYEPESYEIIEKTPKRTRVLLRGIQKAWVPKNPGKFDKHHKCDVDIEFTFYADSPVIRFKWCFTSLMRFNCPYMWLKRYVFSLPLTEGACVIDGDKVENQDKFGEWVLLDTPGGTLAMAFPFYEWLGVGGGIEVKDGRIGQGGINPPVDGGFGNKNPDIHRKIYYGMSRTFEGSIMVGADVDQAKSEAKPICIIVSPQHYSDCGELPENGSKVDFGPFKEVTERAANWLRDNQWKGTFWFGEWWREIDIDDMLGIEEVNSGNSALAPLYHFFRTGDYAFFECAKMSYYYTYDLQFCKRIDGDGPYMHTRRFLLDHQEWFHPRYQRVGGIIKPSFLFGGKTLRDKTYWMLKFWGEKYVSDDGYLLSPERNGIQEKMEETAMTNFIDSLMYAYNETADEFYLDTAKKIGDRVARMAEENIDKLCENVNSTRYIQQGMLPLIRVTGDQKYIDAYVKVAEWTSTAKRHDHGTHYNAFHFNFASHAYKLSGKKEILINTLDQAKWVLSKESKELPGCYPFLNGNQYPPARWICSYDQQAITAYLPVLATTLKEAGIEIDWEPHIK
ncbi:MAG: hypothetical protein SNJ70_07110 [Armatimonadota bacterium]